MNSPVFQALMEENSVTPEVLSTLYVIMEFGRGIPIYLLSEHEDAIMNAKDAGFILLSNDKIYPTLKANKFIYDLLRLAEKEGQL